MRVFKNIIIIYGKKVESVFECKKCGQCCAGKGGIVMTYKEIERIANFLKVSLEVFVEKYTYQNNNKVKLKSQENNYCIFFQNGEGCLIHSVKPDVCQAWPFFKGNLEDEISFSLARQGCEGINPRCEFKDFVAEGIAYLHDNGLIKHSKISGMEDQTPNALKINSKLFDPSK